MPPEQDQKPFCYSPFYNLTVDSIGKFRICCATKQELGSTSDQLPSHFNKSEEIKSLQKSMLAKSSKERDQYCKNCINREANGLSSHRLRYNQSVERLFNNNARQHLNDGPTTLDISFSNICNLTCVMCSSQYSHKWLPIEINMNIQHQYTRGFKKHQLPKAAVDDLINLAINTKRITIKGGEPLFDPQCLYFLEQIGKKNYSGIVFIVTNLTTLSPKIIDLLSCLKTVKVVVSIDGTGSIYEWIRGSSFDKLTQNLQSLFSIDSITSVSPALTISVFNLWNLIKYIPWIHNLYENNHKMKRGDFLQIAIYSHVSCRHYPLTWRKQLESKIQALPMGQEYLSPTLKSALRFKESTIKERQMFLNWTQKFNSFRNLDIFTVEPRLKKLLDETDKLTNI